MNLDLTPKIGVVSFTYIHLEQIPLLEEILSSNKHGIRQLHERYVLLSNDEENKFHHDCPMIELLKKDVVAVKKEWIAKYYQDLINKYGKELVDLLIIEDAEIIQNKILYILNFAMDQIYKSTTLRVELSQYSGFQDVTSSSMPDLIYSTIGMNFDIIDQYLLGEENYIIIKRRICND